MSSLIYTGCETCGIDEAGRGPLAGPVCAAAVVLPDGFYAADLDDSKKISAKKRDELYNIIISSAVSYGVGFASVEEIEEFNILNATFIAMKRAFSLIDLPVENVLVDGNRDPNLGVITQCVVKGDSTYASIAAASILAKVTRDRLMVDYSEMYPGYGFEKHKGYGTKDHYAALRTLGPCPIHRASFLKNMH